MNKKVLNLLAVIPLVILGYYFYQNLSGNTDTMLTYLEETDEITFEFNLLTEQEFLIEDEAELEQFTREILIPGLEELIAKSEAYGNTIEKEDLKAVHKIHDDALRTLVKAEKAWLEENDEEIDQFYEESDKLFNDYQAELNKLAKKWGVEIEWEDQ